MFDNGLYGETGMQASHTQGGVDLCQRGARLRHRARARHRRTRTGCRRWPGCSRTSNRTLFARVRITPDDPPRVLPEKDGVVIKDRVRAAAAAIG